MKVWTKVDGVYRQVDPKWLENRDLALAKAKELPRGSQAAANLKLLAISSAMKAGL